MVERLARDKALRSSGILREQGQELAEVFVVGGDTAVLCDGQVLAKPDDDADARRMLTLLSGRRHDVVSGIAVCSGVDLVIESAIEVTTVWVRSLSENDITWYLRTGEHKGKAGAYAIQGAAAIFVQRVEGDYSAIVGLPLAGLERVINRFGRSLLEFASP